MDYLPLGAALLAVLALFIGVHQLVSDRRHQARLERNLDYYEATYLSISGAAMNGEPGYELRSFDGGLHWYALDTDYDGVVIKGEAETVYPGLLAQVEGIKRLEEHVRRYGPIGSRPLTTADIEALTGAGFGVNLNGTPMGEGP